MRIKKQYFYGSLGILSIGLGLFLLTELIKALSTYGFVGYVILGIFIVSLIAYLRYDSDLKIKEKMADEATKEAISEYAQKINGTDLTELRAKLNSHLKQKIYEESYTLFGK